MRPFLTLFIASVLLTLFVSAAPTQPNEEKSPEKPNDGADLKKPEEEGEMASPKPIDDKKPEEEREPTMKPFEGNTDNGFTNIVDIVATTNGPEISKAPENATKGPKKGRKKVGF